MISDSTASENNGISFEELKERYLEKMKEVLPRDARNISLTFQDFDNDGIEELIMFYKHSQNPDYYPETHIDIPGGFDNVLLTYKNNEVYCYVPYTGPNGFEIDTYISYYLKLHDDTTGKDYTLIPISYDDKQVFSLITINSEGISCRDVNQKEYEKYANKEKAKCKFDIIDIVDKEALMIDFPNIKI